MLAELIPVSGVVLRFDWKSLTWLGFAQNVADEAFRNAMIAIWSAGLWLMSISLHLVDVFTVPDLSATGPLRTVVPITMGVAVAVGAVLVLGQLCVVVVRRDARVLGETVAGMVQFGLVWAGYLTVLAVAVAAAQGLTVAILHATMGVDALGSFDLTKSFPRRVNDTIVATLLAILTPFLIIPASVGVILTNLARAAALLILAAVSPITTAGLLSSATRRWFWVANRWFAAAVCMTPLCALTLGIGVQLNGAVVDGAGGDGLSESAQAVGTSVVAMITFVLAAICPLTLFRLFAFVDPGTTSGAALRAGMSANGWLLGKTKGSGGSGAAAQTDSSGQSQGEATAQQQTADRVTPSGLSEMNDMLMVAAKKAVSIGGDVLNMAGVGHQQHIYPDHDNSTGHRHPGRPGDDDTGENGQDPAGESPDTPEDPGTEDPGDWSPDDADGQPTPGGSDDMDVTDAGMPDSTTPSPSDGGGDGAAGDAGPADDISGDVSSPTAASGEPTSSTPGTGAAGPPGGWDGDLGTDQAGTGAKEAGDSSSSGGAGASDGSASGGEAGSAGSSAGGGAGGSAGGAGGGAAAGAAGGSGSELLVVAAL